MANTLKFGNGLWATKEGSTLAYNDENDNYKPLPFDFTRASNATVVNKEGLIETVGNGIPRIDFSDSEDGALLLEPQRTNLITYSEDFSQWVKEATVTLTSNYGISPDGTQNSTRAQMDVNDSIYISATSGNNFSIYIKGVQNETIRFANGGALTHTLTGEWDRISLYDTVNSSSLVSINTYGGATARDIEIYGAQLEAGSYATSYIPTSGSSVTRLLDSCSQTVPSGIIGQTEGTMFFEIDFANTSGVAGAWSISNGSSANRITMNTTNYSSTHFTLSVAQNYNSGSTKLASSNVTFSDKHKVVIKYSGTTLKLFVDGQLSDSVSTDGFGNYTKFYIGGNQVGVGGDARKFIQADLYNTALTDQELAVLTS